MKTRATISLTLLASLNLVTGFAGAQEAVELEAEQDKLYYFMGTIIGNNLQTMQLTDEQLEFVLRGTRDAIHGEAIELDPNVYGPRLNQLGAEQQAAALTKEHTAAEQYLERMAAEDGAQTMPSGLIFLPLSVGTGTNATATSTVRVQYHGTLRDGTVFDSTVERGGPIEIPLQKVIPCWQEAISMLSAGGKAKITCPAELAYQDRGAGDVPAGAAITFEVELISIIE